MIGQLLRREFDSGRAGLYVFVLTPISILTAFAFPPSFLPFITAAAFFPVYFYYTRRENHFMALVLLGVWALMSFSELSFVVSLGPEAIGKALGLSKQGSDLASFAWKMADVVYSMALAAVSGGAFFVIKAAMKINDAAFNFGNLLSQGNPVGALLSLNPWKLMTSLGHALAAQGSSSVFYSKLEGARIHWGKIGWLISAGFALAVAGVLGETVLQ